MKIYTKTGDKGETNLLDNKRVSKDNIRVEAYGTVDELNAHIALIYTLIEQAECKQYLEKIENTLFLIQTHLAIGNRKDYTYMLSVQYGNIRLWICTHYTFYYFYGMIG